MIGDDEKTPPLKPPLVTPSAPTLKLAGDTKEVCRVCMQPIEPGGKCAVCEPAGKRVEFLGTKPIEPPPSVKERLKISLGSVLITAVNLPTGRESALMRTKIEEALMWLDRVPQ